MRFLVEDIHVCVTAVLFIVPRFVSNIVHAKLNAIFLLVALVEESILIHIIFFYR